MSHWYPFIARLEGSLEAGGHLEVTIAPPGHKPTHFRPTVLAVLPERDLRWRGTVLGRYGFAGEHIFQLPEKSDDETHFHHGEIFSG